MSISTESLSPAQIKRQDHVDNLIHTLLNELDPRPKEITEGRREQLIEWNISPISRVREVIQEVLADEIQILDEDRDQFEREFYPELIIDEAE